MCGAVGRGDFPLWLWRHPLVGSFHPSTAPPQAPASATPWCGCHAPPCQLAELHRNSGAVGHGDGAWHRWQTSKSPGARPPHGDLSTRETPCARRGGRKVCVCALCAVRFWRVGGRWANVWMGAILRTSAELEGRVHVPRMSGPRCLFCLFPFTTDRSRLEGL